MSDNFCQLSPLELSNLVERFVNGEESCADDLCNGLSRGVQVTCAKFFKFGSADAEDIFQETLIVSLNYLRTRDSFEGNFQSFCNTIAANRCRDLLRFRTRYSDRELYLESFEDWIADPSRSALDYLVEEDQLQILQQCLTMLSTACKNLLSKLYLQGYCVERIRSESGVSTVQAIYYRRSQCLKQAHNFFKKIMNESSNTRRDDHR
ncbi:MAG: RNA polymerase sigma factor [bacterium]|nr:RNA polymerase sigma factor [bacterium]